MISVVKGCDPEVFLKQIGRNAFVSGIGIIGGSKEEPLPIGEGCAIQEDNVAAEFCIPPAKNVEDFIKSIQYNLDHLKDKVSKIGLELAIVPSAEFPDEELMTPAAQQFGCEPDFNAWNDGHANPRPESDNYRLRSAGGHVHVSLPRELMGRRLLVIQALDLFIGCQMIQFDKDTKRRELYGKAGAFRPKPYGVEYRTPSNAWIMTDSRIRWVWDQVDAAVQWVLDGGTFNEQQGKMIQDCINNSDFELLDKLNAEFFE